MTQLDRQNRSSTLGELIQAFENASTFAAATKDKWENYRRIWKPLEDRRAESLDTVFWREWLDQIASERKWEPVTYNDCVARLSSVYRHGMPDLVASNPMDSVKRRKAKRKPTAVWTLDQIEEVLSCAWTHDREMVPFFALAVFAGLRPESELGRLKWEHIDFKRNQIQVAEEFDNKTETKRWVPLFTHLRAWLELG